MEQCVQAGFDQFLCGNLGAVALARQLGAGVHGSFGLNIYNTASLEFFRTLGLSTAELSLELTAREFELLHTFLSSPGRVFTREVLLAKLWGYDFFGDERVVDSHIKNLRHKLGIDCIETVRGVGYRAAKEAP